MPNPAYIRSQLARVSPYRIRAYDAGYIRPFLMLVSLHPRWVHTHIFALTLPHSLAKTRNFFDSLSHFIRTHTHAHTPIHIGKDSQFLRCSLSLSPLPFGSATVIERRGRSSHTLWRACAPRPRERAPLGQIHSARYACVLVFLSHFSTLLCTGW